MNPDKNPPSGNGSSKYPGESWQDAMRRDHFAQRERQNHRHRIEFENLVHQQQWEYINHIEQGRQSAPPQYQHQQGRGFDYGQAAQYAAPQYTPYNPPAPPPPPPPPPPAAPQNGRYNSPAHASSKNWAELNRIRKARDGHQARNQPPPRKPNPPPGYPYLQGLGVRYGPDSDQWESFRQVWCGNCGKQGHTITTCIGPLHEGLLQGCPRCNQAAHNLDDCPARKSTEKDLFNYLVRKRDKRPPLAYGHDFRDVPGFRENNYRPWTRAFAVENALRYQTHIYRTESQDEILESDPAWGRSKSIPSQALGAQRDRSRSRSPVRENARPIRTRTPPPQPQYSRQVLRSDEASQDPVAPEEFPALEFPKYLSTNVVALNATADSRLGGESVGATDRMEEGEGLDRLEEEVMAQDEA